MAERGFAVRPAPAGGWWVIRREADGSEYLECWNPDRATCETNAAAYRSWPSGEAELSDHMLRGPIQANLFAEAIHD
jgi:hypothetical protein